MMIDREKALKCFQDYVKDYNIEDEKIRLKVEHTYRVCELCERIARESGFSDAEVEIAWLTGLLHDVGRFEQVRIYGTFIDAESIDHAQFGADILFKEGRIRDYIEDTSEDDLLEKAIRAHSAYRIPEDYSQREQRFAHLLRDADKIDILKVNIIFPLEEIYNVTTKELREAPITEEVFQAFYEEHAVLRSLKKTAVDHVVGHISLMYELVYPVSYRIVEEQGYLDKLMDFESDCVETRERFSQMKEKMRAYLARSSRG
ncbi:MAG: HD domain-containing protein [Lachnospiraceae bacterium]|nr:HD domain-containing protein [Lachnospiraceae bacterium]